MIRYGAEAKAMRPIVSDDLLISRLKLLIIMAKACLKGYPLGDLRKTAIKGNARKTFYDALSRAGAGKTHGKSKQDPSRKALKPRDHFFLQRAQLLAVMLNACVEGKSSGTLRNKAIAENIDHLCDYLADCFHSGDAKFLKVA